MRLSGIKWKHIIFLALISGATLSAKPAEDPVSAQDFRTEMVEASDKGDWKRLREVSRLMISEYKDTPFAEDARYYAGKSDFELGLINEAEEEIGKYLADVAIPRFFEEALELKYECAEKYRFGEKRHLFSKKVLPKMISGNERAIELYNEVIAALPQSPLAAKALYGKGWVQFELGDYRESIETFQNLIRRFPKSSFTPKSYIAIQKVYLTQCQVHYADPDYLALAQLNYEKCKAAFSSDTEGDTVAQVTAIFNEMEEEYASHLVETAQFFERTKKFSASEIYYKHVMDKYPNTKCALISRKGLETLEKKGRLKKGAAVDDDSDLIEKAPEVIPVFPPESPEIAPQEKW